MPLTSIQRRLQVTFAAMTSLGTLLLGMAQDDLRLALLAAVAAGTSVYFTDRKRWLELNTTGANIAGMVALGLTLRNWQTMERELMFLMLANLLVYLQCILHFRSKVPRVYWMLTLLSMLQVTVAAVLTSSYVFGGCLILYLFVTIRALSLFLIHREQTEQRSVGQREATSSPLTLADLMITPVHELIGRLFSLAQGRRGRPSPAVDPTRWPLADVVPGFAHRLRRQDGEVAATRGLWPFVVKMGLGVVLISPVLFLVVPRAGQGHVGWNPVRRTGPTLMGFTEDITLNDVTDIGENPEEVMRVRFFKYADGQRGEPLQLQSDLWLRGAVLGKYEQGRWRRGEWYTPTRRPIRDRPRRPGREDPLLQEITIEPIRDSLVLFSVAPAYPETESSRRIVEIDYHAEQIYRRGELRNEQITYQMLTWGVEQGQQIDFRPDRSERPPYEADDQRDHLRRPFFLVRQDDLSQRRQLAELNNVADRVVSGQGLNPRQDPRATAKALERFFFSDGGFSYTLQPPPRDPALDPIVDFVVNSRRGHCEYFASALALMLRSQDIPARVVVGYKGGEWNEMGKYYQVRQLNAHAWVEAWVVQDGQAGWLRLDPTPPGYEAEESFFSGVGQLANYLDYLWGRYVLGMDPRLQRETVFDPLRAALAKVFDQQSWQAQSWQAWYRELESTLTGTSDSRSWGRIVVAALALLLVVPAIVMGCYKLMAFLVRRLSGRGGVRTGRRRGGPQVEFYQRLERLLSQLGMQRPPAQTAQEFALIAAARLAGDPALQPLAPLPARVVEAFYRVRYGGQSLAEEDVVRVQQALDQLEAAVHVQAKARRAEKKK